MENTRTHFCPPSAGRPFAALAAVVRGAPACGTAGFPGGAGPRRRGPAGVLRAAGLILAGLAGIASPAAAAPPGSAAGAARPLGCLIEPDRIADIGSQVVGLVQQLHVERGDRVGAGQALLSLKAEVERANMGVAARRAAIDADVRAAAANLDLARQKVARAEALVAQNFVSAQALDLARGEQELAAQKLNQVQAQREVWIEERHVAAAQLALRTLRSPFDGVIVERFVNLGERVEDRPLMRVAVINPLRVELLVPTAQYGTLALGDSVSILPELPGAAAVSATVSHVDRVLDPASNSFRVRLSLPNPGHRLPAGLRCKAEAVATLAPAKTRVPSTARLTPTASRSGATR